MSLDRTLDRTLDRRLDRTLDGSLVDDPILALGPFTDWYARNLALGDGDLVGTWSEPLNGKDLTQSTTTNKPTFDEDSPVYDKAVYMNGSAAFMTRAFDAAFNAAPFSFYIDFYLQILPSVAGRNEFMISNSHSSFNENWATYSNQADDKLGFRCVNTTGTIFDAISDLPMIVGQCKMMGIFTAANNVQMYLNGALQATAPTLTGALLAANQSLYYGVNKFSTPFFQGWVHRMNYFDKEVAASDAINATTL